MAAANNKRHVIWGDIHLNYDDWKDDLEANYPELTDSERYELMYDLNHDYLEDERVNLNIQMSQPIICIADLGRWNGRFSGYKEIPSGNIRDCLYSDTDWTEWYVDHRGDLKADGIHHDGTNHYLYRVYKDEASESQRDALKQKIFDNKATRADITRVTRRLGDEIAKVYGFEIPRKSKSRETAR
ncbi:MAG: hypothetical protein IKQ92_03455 [Clostridia bacterium]|nr:hypothetical protein [Clostridia bacterium]